MTKFCSEAMPNVSFEAISYTRKKPLCVFGCLMSDRGKTIKQEMLAWITTKYDVICVNQEYPGKLYEFPALMFAKWYSEQRGTPVLYLHTKGAFNPTNVYGQAQTRSMWKEEFIDHYEWYQDIVATDKLAVAAPFVSDAPWGVTWTNGFIAGADAWKNAIVRPPEPPHGRLVYEFIFRNVEYKPYSRILSGVNHVEDYIFERMKSYINAIQV